VSAAAASRFFVGPLAGRLLGGGFGDDRNAPASASARSLSRRPTARAPPTQPSCAPRAHSRPQSALRLRVAFNSEPLEERRVAGPLGEEIKASTPLPQGPPLVLFGVDPALSSGPHEHRRIQHLDGYLGAAARPIKADVLDSAPAKSLYAPAIRDVPEHPDGVADAHVGLHDVKVQAINDSLLLLKELLTRRVKLPCAGDSADHMLGGQLSVLLAEQRCALEGPHVCPPGTHTNTPCNFRLQSRHTAKSTAL